MFLDKIQRALSCESLPYHQAEIVSMTFNVLVTVQSHCLPKLGPNVICRRNVAQKNSTSIAAIANARRITNVHNLICIPNYHEICRKTAMLREPDAPGWSSVQIIVKCVQYFKFY